MIARERAHAVLLLAAALLLASCASSVPGSAPQDVSTRLDTTPRHDEWVQIESAGRALHAYVSYPERSSLSPAILVIHENRGLTDWVRSVADRLAEAGYVAIAPDMLSGVAPGGGRTSDFPSQDAARTAISALPPSQVASDLDAAGDWVLALPSVNGTLSVAGFCWGGSRTWEVANRRSDLEAAYVFYGTGPDEPGEVANIDAPVFGFYGGDDMRVNATIPRTEELMRERGQRFEYEIYEGAGHAFMRAGEEADASAADRRARDQAWQRWLMLLRDRDSRSP